MALDALLSDKYIVIKPADKGGAICIQDAEKYKLQILSQLTKKDFYQKLTSDPTFSFQKEIHTFWEGAREWILQSELHF